METKQILKNRVEAHNRMIDFLIKVKPKFMRYLMDNEIKIKTTGDLFKKIKKALDHIIQDDDILSWIRVQSYDFDSGWHGSIMLRVKTSYQNGEETCDYLEKTQYIYDITSDTAEPWQDWEEKRTTVKEQQKHLQKLENLKRKKTELDEQIREIKTNLIKG